MTTNMTQSISPSGESFPLPDKADYSNELKRIENLLHQARSEKKEIVVVMGLGSYCLPKDGGLGYWALSY